MKKLRLILFSLILIPAAAMSQWGMVRYDQVNVFNKAFTATPSTVILTGMELTASGSFFMRSNDGGVTWDSITVNSSTISYQLSSLFFTDVNNGYAGGYKNLMQGLLKTTDNGSTWTDITPDPLSSDQISALYFVNPLSGYASAGITIYKTTDGGLSWTSLPISFTSTGIVFSDMLNGYACGGNGTNSIVMQTNDGGVSWTNVLTAIDPFTTGSTMAKADITAPGEVIVMMEYTNRLYRTVNGGVSWDTITIASITSPIQDFDFITSNKGRIVSMMGEIYVTYDAGLTWTMEYATAQGAYGPTVFLYSLSFSGNVGYVSGSNGLVKKYTDEPLAIGENNIVENISIYPNPVTSQGEILISLPRDGFTGELTIYNSLGQTIFADNIQSPAAGQFKLSAAGFNTGIYFITLKSESQNFKGKLFVRE
jgi:photosystem II stability/assembly factor-like uncharacterized protein